MRDGGHGQDADAVEFLDPDDGEGAPVQWLDEEGVGSGAGPGSLPPRAAPRRVLASLLAFGLFLAGVGTAATAAYHRHVTDRRIAGLLVLRAAPDAPAVPDLPTLGFATTWHAHVTERVLVPVVNRGPRPVLLLGASLVEPGLVATAALAPVGAALLEPGRTGELAGEVTADCTSLASVAVAVIAASGNAGAMLAPTAMTVRARTEGGATRSASVDPENSSPDLQTRICGQQGDLLTGADAFRAAADPHSRAVTIRLSTRTDADIPVDYAASAFYSTDPAHTVPGLVLSAAPVPGSPVSGTLAPGAALRLEFTIRVQGCPSRPIPHTDAVLVQVAFSVKGSALQTSDQGAALAPLVAQACGTAGTAGATG